MTGTQVVGPVPNRVTFGGGSNMRWHTPRALYPTVVYSVPRNTLDPRYRTCRDHHVACDCREAELAEQINELRMELRDVREAIDAVLVGHLTDNYVGQTPCQCTGCQIARRAHLFNHNGAES